MKGMLTRSGIPISKIKYQERIWFYWLVTEDRKFDGKWYDKWYHNWYTRSLIISIGFESSFSASHTLNRIARSRRSLTFIGVVSLVWTFQVLLRAQIFARGVFGYTCYILGPFVLNFMPDQAIFLFMSEEFVFYLHWNSLRTMKTPKILIRLLAFFILFSS